MKRALSAILAFLKTEQETLLAFTFSRLLLWLLAWLAYHSVRHGKFGIEPRGDELWNMLFRWDSNWYRAIMEAGYTVTVGESSVAFFPLFPLCLRLVCGLTGAGVPLGGFLFSNACLLGAVVLLRRLVALDFPKPSRVPNRTVWLFLLLPVTFFYSAVYTESLFILLSLGAFLAARQGRWAVAAFAGAFLTATRPNGIIILVPLLWEAVVNTRRFPLAQPSGGLRSRWWLLIVPAGLVAFSAYLHVRFGDALAFAHAQAAWGRALATPWHAVALAVEMYGGTHVRLFLGAEVLALAAFFLALHLRLRPSYLLYCGVMLLLFLCNTRLESLPRFLSALFPLQIAIAAFATRFSEGFYFALLAASTALLALCLILYTGGYWMT